VGSRTAYYGTDGQNTGLRTLQVQATRRKLQGPTTLTGQTSSTQGMYKLTLYILGHKN